MRQMPMLRLMQKQRVPEPAKKWTCCPACGSKELISVGPETLCGKCDWETTLISVQKGKMDQIITACKEQYRGTVCRL